MIRSSASITLTVERDINTVWRYYALVPSAGSVPTVPEAYPPPSTIWSTSEPSYDGNSTQSLYTLECTVFSDGGYAYSNVCKSSSYEAAKVAYNKAANAQSAASEAQATANAKADPMTATAHGGEIAVSDSADAAIGGLVLYGKSEQGGQTTGKNLLPFEVNTPVAPNGVTINILPDGGVKIVGTTTALTTYMFHADTSKLNIPAGTYRFLLTGSGTGFTDSNILLQLYTNTGSGLTSRLTTTDGTYTIGSNVTADYVRLRIASGVTYDCVVYPMVMLDSETDTTFEPYTGAMPAPNPLFPCPVKSAGMTLGKNLLRDLRGGITSGGVTFTPMADGGLHISGTASAVIQYNPYTDYTVLNIPHGMYRVLITGTGTGAENARVQLYENRGSGLVVAFAWNNEDYICIVRDDVVANTIRIRVAAGTYDCVVYPMVLPAYTDDTSFEGYTNGPVGTQITLKTIGKNLIEDNLPVGYTNTANGVTVTKLPDGSYMLNGTATAQTAIILNFASPDAVVATQNDEKAHVGPGTYTASGLVTGTKLYIIAANNPGNTGVEAIANFLPATPTAIVPSGWKYTWIRLTVLKNATFNNTIIRPMLRLSEIEDDTWEPYKAAVTTLPTPNGLPGIKVSTGGNYTDADGQQWICDTIDLAAGTYTKRVGQYTFNGSEGWATGTLPSSLGSSLRRFRYNGLASQIMAPPSDSSTVNAACSHYAVKPFTTSGGVYYANQGISVSDVGGINIYDETYGTESGFAAWKAMLAANPMHCLFALATPVTTPLTEAQLTALRSLRTRAGSTVLTNDAGADMDLTYATRTGGGSYVEGVRQGLDDDVNRAQAAADAAQVTADAAREDFRRVVRIDTEGLHVGDSQTSNEVMIDSESVNVVLGGRKYSKFAGDYVQFGDYQLRRSVDGGLVFKKA